MPTPSLLQYRLREEASKRALHRAEHRKGQGPSRVLWHLDRSMVPSSFNLFHRIIRHGPSAWDVKVR